MDGNSSKPVVLITGAEGRIGKALAEELAKSFTVVGFERSCKGEHCIDADITSDASLAAAFARLQETYGRRIASVIHLAAFYDFSGEPNRLYDEVNVRGTRRLLQALRAFEVEQFIYASTMLVHAPTRPGLPIDEDAPLKPEWPYPQSKLSAEHIVNAERGRIPALVLRLAGVYTTGCELPSLAHQVARIYERQMTSRLFPGDPSHGQAFVHLDDVMQAFRLAVERRGKLPEETTLLIGEPVTESYESLQNMIGRLVHGEPWETRAIPKSVAAAGAWLQEKAEDAIPDAIDRGIEPFIKPFMVPLADAHYELDIARAGQLLDWRPQHALRGSLPAMIGGLRKDPALWYRCNKVPPPLWLEETPGQNRSSADIVAEFRAFDRLAHQRTLWCHFANISLGLWLICSPFILGLVDSSASMTASDIGAGAMIAVFGLLSLARDAGWARWTVAATGLWLLFAPLLLWTTSAAAYANDTLVGALAIVLAVGIPNPPGISPVAQVAGPDAPAGWDYNPSSWTNRLPIVALAFVGLFISRYLAAYQLGHIDAAWDPLFGSGTERIITSSVSQAWPVSDAGLGAAVYALEIVTGVIGDKRRWRTMPWLVLLFGLLIVPLGAVSIFFIMIQPVVIGTWCTLCLVGALAMLLQIPYSFDEILATLQFLKARRQQGRNLWYLLMHGDTTDQGSADLSDDFEAPAGVVVREMLTSGVSVPWMLSASTAIGVALMCSRLLFDTSAAAADSDHIIGSLVVTFSIMAWSDVARPLRLANIGFGAWLLVAPWMLAGFSAAGAAATVLSGIALIWLALVPFTRPATPAFPDWRARRRRQHYSTN